MQNKENTNGRKKIRKQTIIARSIGKKIKKPIEKPTENVRNWPAKA